MAKELTNSAMMNALIRGGKLSKRQEEEAAGLSPETVIADVRTLVDQLPEGELDAFHEAVIAVLYDELDNAEVTS